MLLLPNNALGNVASCYTSSDVLLSQAVSHQVPSALKGLTSVFGMGTGVTPSLLSLEFDKLSIKN